MALAELPLYSPSFYTFTTLLDGTRWRFEGEWSDRLRVIHMSLFDTDDNPVVLGQALQIGSGYNWQSRGGPSGTFVVVGPPNQEGYSRDDVVSRRVRWLYIYDGVEP